MAQGHHGSAVEGPVDQETRRRGLVAGGGAAYCANLDGRALGGRLTGSVVLGWDGLVAQDAVVPRALSPRLDRLTELGVDVVVVTAGDADRVAAVLDGTGRGGPGRLLVLAGERPQVFELGGTGLSPVPTPEPLGSGAVDWVCRWVLGHGALEGVAVDASGGTDEKRGAALLADLDDLVAARSSFPEPVSDPSWRLDVHGFDARTERDVESWLTVANGRSGTRGSLEEGGPASLVALYVAGVYGRPAGEGAVPELVRGPEWTSLLPRADDEAVDMGEAAVIVHVRVLDLRQGMVFREWRQRLRSGAEWIFRSARFASLADRHILALQAEARAGTDSASLTSDVIPFPAGQEIVESSDIRADGRRVLATATGRGGATAELAVSTHVREGGVERLASVARRTAGPGLSESAEKALVAAEATGISRLRARHTVAWRHRWRDADVVVEGDPYAQRALRFALYHLMSSGDPESDLASIGARGLTGPGYKGHVFWDTEIFVLPFLIWTHPPTARALLAYRHRTLPAARDKAARLGYSGALYPWESADTGEETTPERIVLSDGTLLDIHTQYQEHHISADVAWAVWRYWQVTADQAFLVDMGAEIILETARFWASRATPGDDGRHHVRKVIGPDEYHEGVDDSAYTNVLARWNLLTACEVCDLVSTLDPSAWRALAARIGLDPSEPARWREVANGLVDGFRPDSLLYEQFAGFFDLQDLRAVDLAPRPFTAELMVGVDRLPHTQVVKQADVVMLAHVLPEVMPVASLAANYRYYEPRTCHGSSLSPAIHAAVAARAGFLDDAEQYFRMSAGVDLDDRMGNAAQGVHIATMGGLWQAAVVGFGGVGTDGESFRVDPHLPPSWSALSFPVRWRGTRVDVEIGPDSVGLTLDAPASVAVGTGPPVPLEAGSFVARRSGDGWSASEAAGMT